MKQSVENSENKPKKKHKGILLFLKATVSSQVASWIDMGLSFILFAFVIPNAYISKAIGAATGGVVNCFINYKWTFQAKNVSKRYVVVKYALVWFGSWGLNTFGTGFVTGLLSGLTILSEWGVTDNGCMMAAQLAVSLVVSIFWNFQLQRYFVFRDVPVKATIKKITKK